MSIIYAMITAAVNGYSLNPDISYSDNFKHWMSIKDWKRCRDCAEYHGKIYPIEEEPYPKPPIHDKDRCVIDLMEAIRAGTATINEKTVLILHCYTMEHFRTIMLVFPKHLALGGNQVNRCLTLFQIK